MVVSFIQSGTYSDKIMDRINISIPQPCHENWGTMTPEGKGRFCASCQKNVIDFTNASDREILTAFQKNENLCGRFLESQLNRDLIKPERKNPLWLATTSAMISFIGFGTQEAIAQNKAKIEQTDKKILKNLDKPTSDNILVSGIVYDENNTPIPHLGLYVRGAKIGETNENGNFSIYTHLRSRIVFRNADDDDDDATDYYVRKENNANIEINTVKYIRVVKSRIVLGGSTVVKAESITKGRTFFGKILYRIGNLFR